MESEITTVTSESIKDGVDKTKIQTEFEEFMKEMSKFQKDDGKFTKEYQMNRLITRKFVNPYDILELGAESSDVEIKRKYRMLSMLIHPDKNKHERAADAFALVDKAYKTLMDVEKRRTYQRVMREAKERVEVERARINSKREA